MEANNLGVSVIVCCYNSAARLPETLRHLSLQNVLANIPWEIIIVNNASKDNTVEVAKTIWTNSGCNVSLRIVDQSIPGLSYAREKGIESAVFEYLLFCDDDNWLDENYVKNVYNIMTANPRAAVLGGIGNPVCETHGAKWFDDFKSYYAVGEQSAHSGNISLSRSCVYGAGATFRKSALLELKNKGQKSWLSDRMGEKLVSGGDNELCYSLVLADYEIWYDQNLTFKHFVPQNRLKWSYIKRLDSESAQSVVLLLPYIHTIKKRDKIKRSTAWQIGVEIYFMLKLLKKYTLEKQTNRYYHIYATLNNKINTIIGLIKFRKEMNHIYQYINSASWVHEKYKNLNS